jgi:hypothetical protein
MSVRIQIRRDSSANWVANNPSLREGEIGIELDTLKIKIGPEPVSGDSTPWNSITNYANLVPSDFDSIIDGYLEVTDIGAQGGVVGLNSSKNAIVPGSAIIIEGPTNDSYETTLTVTDPTADRTITLPDASGTIALTSDLPQITITQVDASGTATETYSGISTIAFDEDSGFDVTNPSTGVAKIAMNSTFKYWEVDGVQKLTAVALDTVNFVSGNGIDITADGNADPQSITITGDLTELLPDQNNETGKFLQTDGETVSWATVDLSTKANISNPEFTTGDAGTIVAAPYSGPQGTFPAGTGGGTAGGYGLSGAYAGYNTYDKNHIPSGWENHIPSDMSYYVGKIMVISGGEQPSCVGEWPIMEAAIGPQNQGYPILFGLGNSFPGANQSNNGATVSIKTPNTLKTISSTEVSYLDGVTSSIQDQLDDKSTIDSPTFTGTPAAPTATAGTNTTQIATTAFVKNAVDDLIGNAPGALDTLNELAAAINDDASYAATISTALGNKQDKVTGVSDTEIGYLNGVTSAIQDQIDDKLDSTTASTTYQAIVSGVSDTEIGYLNGVTSAIQTQLGDKQDKVSGVSDTEIGYLSGVTSLIQDQLDSKAPSANPEFTVSYMTPYAITDQDGLYSFFSTTSTYPVTLDPVTGALTNPEFTPQFSGYFTRSFQTWYGAWPQLLEYISVPTSATATVSAAEIRYLDGVTSAIQTQLDNKLSLSGGTMTGALTLSGAPSSSLHATTKQYVDNIASGIVAKPQVLGATTANIDATYDNGTAGVGATLTHNSNGALPSTAGGATGWAVGKGILVKNQTNKAENGRYYVSDMGSPSTPYVLTRCGYCDEASEIPGSYIFVQAGTSAGTGWVQSVADASTFTVGTDDINVYQFSGSGTITAGNGISVSGNEVSIDTAVTQARVDGVSDTEIGYLNGVTSNIQDQIDAVVPSQTGNAHKVLTTDGTLASWGPVFVVDSGSNVFIGTYPSNW